MLYPLSFQKVHMFQKSVEVVKQRLTEAEASQAAFIKTHANNLNNEANAQVFRNQLKVSVHSCWPRGL